MFYIFPIGAIVLGLVVSSMVKKQNVMTWLSAPGLVKALIWLSALLNPVFGGITLYYSMRKNFPEIAKKANRISFIAFGLWLIVYAIYYGLLVQT